MKQIRRQSRAMHLPEKEVGPAAPVARRDVAWALFEITRAARRIPSSRWAPLGLLAFFWLIGLSRLDALPPIHEDEPWQVSTAYKLATEGIFGSDMFAGFGRMDERYYGFLPLHPLLLAAIFRVAGLGLFQARFEALALGLLALALTYSLGRRLFSPVVGLLALTCLIFLRTAGTTLYQPTGILFVDLARVARYDIAVPVFGLAALHATLSARRSGTPAYYLLAGALAGLAGLAHLYGAFWLPALLVLSAWHDGRAWLRRPGGYLLVAGCVLVWVPYVAFVLTDLDAFRMQNAVYVAEHRFELTNPDWYLQNIREEFRRYAPGLGSPQWTWLTRLGFWSVLAGVPPALVALGWRAVRRNDPAARAVIVPFLVLAGFFALLLRLKTSSYTLTLAPLAAVVLAWGVYQLWGWLGPRPRPGLTRSLVLLAFIGGVAEGAWQVREREIAGSRLTPYSHFIARVADAIPADARILGLHNYWLGLHDRDYRALWVPLRWTDPLLTPEPVSFPTALDRVAPDVVLVDPRLRRFLDEASEPTAPGYDLAAGFRAWFDQRRARLLVRVEDPTYGPLDVYQVERPDQP